MKQIEEPSIELTTVVNTGGLPDYFPFATLLSSRSHGVTTAEIRGKYTTTAR